MSVDVFIGLGDLRQSVLKNLRSDLSNSRKILLEYIGKHDVTFLYINGSWLSGNDTGSIIKSTFYEAWFNETFAAFKPHEDRSFYPLHHIIPESRRVFYSHQGGSVSGLYSVQRECKGLFSVFDMELPVPDGFEAVRHSKVLDMRHHDAKEILPKIRSTNRGNITEIFTAFRQLSEDLLPDEPKYRVTINDRVSIYNFIESIGFNTLGEIKRFFRKKGWSRVAPAEYSPFDQLDVDIGAQRPIEALTIPYLILSSMIVRA